MSEPQAQKEEVITAETETQIDAIHPRFLEPQNEAKIKEYQEKNNYFCRKCKLFFAPSVRGLNEHFKAPFREHSPCASCFYCKGNVYDYIINNKTKYYHNCRDQKP